MTEGGNGPSGLKALNSADLVYKRHSVITRSTAPPIVLHLPL